MITQSQKLHSNNFIHKETAKYIYLLEYFILKKIIIISTASQTSKRERVALRHYRPNS